MEGFLLPKIKYQQLSTAKGYRLSIDMFKNGFIHRIKVGVSRPVVTEPRTHSNYEEFYNSDDEYVNSDTDFDDVVGKR